MSKEIEVKYLIKENGKVFATSDLMFYYNYYNSIANLESDVLSNGEPIRQGYLPIQRGIDLANVLKMKWDFQPTEARLRDREGYFFFTLKGDGGTSRPESELEITATLFYRNWNWTRGKRVEKSRLVKSHPSGLLELDVYTDRDLIVAEIEVRSIEKAEELRLRPLGQDVTEDSKYKNKNLAK